MGFVSDKVSDAISGNRGSTLQDFLNKFSSSSSRLVNQLDPLLTFDISMRFFPTLNAKVEDARTDTQKTLDYFADAAKTAGMNALNNATGGLADSIMLETIFKKADVLKQRDSFKHKGKRTFLEYLTEAYMMMSANLGSGDSNSGNLPLELLLTPYIQRITIPQMKMADGGKVDTSIGSFPLNGGFVTPDNNSFQLTVLNTRLPLLEQLFYPWMREVTLPYWSYQKQPYTTATTVVDMTKHSNVKYVFCGCRPQQLQLQQPTQEADGVFTRDVTILFDYMFITTDFKTYDSTMDKLREAGGALFSSASQMIGI